MESRDSKAPGPDPVVEDDLEVLARDVARARREIDERLGKLLSRIHYAQRQRRRQQASEAGRG